MPFRQNTALPRSATTRGDRIHRPAALRPPRRSDPAAAAPELTGRCVRQRRPVHLPWLTWWKPELKPDAWRRLAAVLVCLIVFTGGRMTCAPHRQQAVRTADPLLRHTAGTPLDEYGAVAIYQSPNSGERPLGALVNAVVLHATATDTGQEAVNTFLDPASKRSSHFIIDRNGAIIEMVAPRRQAWHAGVSAMDGVPNLNDYSVGVEMVDRNDGQPYSDVQYAAAAALIRRLRVRYNIPDNRIVSHAAVALPPGRKSDPVGFDFTRLFATLRN